MWTKSVGILENDSVKMIPVSVQDAPKVRGTDHDL